jgi:hypothetical protein
LVFPFHRTLLYRVLNLCDLDFLPHGIVISTLMSVWISSTFLSSESNLIFTSWLSKSKRIMQSTFTSPTLLTLKPSHSCVPAYLNHCHPYSLGCHRNAKGFSQRKSSNRCSIQSPPPSMCQILMMLIRGHMIFLEAPVWSNQYERSQEHFWCDSWAIEIYQVPFICSKIKGKN